MTNIAWAMLDGKDLLQAGSFDGKTNWEWAMQTLEYGMEFLLKCKFENGQFVTQVYFLLLCILMLTSTMFGAQAVHCLLIQDLSLQ